MSAAVLSVRKLSVFLRDGRAEHAVVDRVSFDLAAGGGPGIVDVEIPMPLQGPKLFEAHLAMRAHIGK